MEIKQNIEVMDLDLNPDIKIDVNSDAANFNLESSARLERRRTPRSKYKVLSLVGRFRDKIDKIVLLVDSGWRGWVVFLVVVSLSLLLMWWSIKHRIGLLSSNYSLRSELIERQAEYDTLLAIWSQDELKKIREQVNNADKDRVFPDYAKLAYWLHNQAFLAEQLSLNMRYIMNPAIPSKIKNISEVPIEIYMNAQDQVSRQAYIRMLKFIRNMIDDHWHLEIVNTVVTSEGSGAESMTLLIRLWVHDEKTIQ